MAQLCRVSYMDLHKTNLYSHKLVHKHSVIIIVLPTHQKHK